MTSTTKITSLLTGTGGDAIFCTSTGARFYIHEFKNGTAVIEPMVGTEIEDFAKVVVGCFRVKSNFQAKSNKLFNSNQPLEAIEFNFNDVEMTITRENANAEKIVKEWHRLDARE